MEISDIENIKKENLSIEPAKDELDKLTGKIIELKDKIEKEINNINIYNCIRWSYMKANL